MKKIVLILSILALLIIAGCTQVTQDKSEKEEPYEKIPIIDGYFNGEKVWFIHPDVSNAETSETLTKMTNYGTTYVPKHNEVVSLEKLAKLYLFSNGISHRGVEPWNGGPFGFQIDIFDSIPGDKDYTSLRRPHVVTWNENAKPRILTSEKDLLAAETAGELSIEATDFVVNVPLVRWPGGPSKLK